MLRGLLLRLQYALLIVRESKYLLGGGSLLVVLTGIYERYSTQAVPSWAYSFIVLTCILLSLFNQGFSLYARARPQLAIQAVIHRQEGENPSGKWVTCYFDVQNLSELESLRNVNVSLESIDPPAAGLPWLPVCLQIKHDRSVPATTNFTLNAQQKRQIDLVTAFVGSAEISVCHTAIGAATVVPSSKQTLTILATAEGVTAVRRRFRVCIDSDGILQCEPIIE